MKFNSYEHTVIAPTSSMSQHFQLEQPSVIKTAPPGGRHNINHFSPKHEPIDIAPLAQSSLQDLSKLQPTMDYYMPSNGGYSTRMYDYMNVAAAAYPSMQSSTPTVFQSAMSNALNSVTPVGNQPQHEWRSADSYVYSNSSRNTSSSSSGIHYITQQQLQQQEALALQQHQESLALAQHEERLYKALHSSELLASPSSTIPIDQSVVTAVDMALLDEAAVAAVAKHDFFLSAGASLSSGATVSHQSHIGQHHHASVITTHPHQQTASTSAADLLHSTTTGLIAAAAAAAAASAQHLDHNHHRREHSIGSLSCSNRDVSPVIIMKLENSLGFQYILEAPISTSIRREEDRMTYVNKGQFYSISLDYIPDPCKLLKGNTVRSVVMVVFREDKSYEEEIKTWQLWHKRQHTTKQRILEVDTKNSTGIIGLVEEVSHNAIQFCWNPNEPLNTKVSIAVQCLSTDFSTQKGVKGLPLHIQIDTYDEADENTKTPFHRGYCQIKVFCDKGAERKLRDEDKRANRRKNATGGGVGIVGTRKKSEGEFHEMCDRSEFYHMSDLDKPAALFIPGDDFDTRFLDTTSIASFEALSELEPLPKRPRTSERIMIYVREDDDEIYTPLHLSPPNMMGLSHAICEKYNLDETKIVGFYKRCCPSGSTGCDPNKTNARNGSVTVKIDDEMIRHYTNQDTFFIEIKSCSDESSYCTVTLVELLSNNNNNNNSCDNCQTPLTPPSLQTQTQQQQHQHQSLYHHTQNQLHHQQQQLQQQQQQQQQQQHHHMNLHHQQHHLGQHHQHQLIQGGQQS